MGTTDEVSKHAIHFYNAGDILLNVGGVLFRVHRGKLSQRSEVFNDMLELPQSEPLDEEKSSDWVVLHDNPDEFAILLDFIYELSIDYANAKQCLQLALLGHKYEVPLVLSSCVGFLEEFLPTGVASRDFSIVQQYYEDPPMIPLALRAARLLCIPQIVPWALYELTIHFGPDRDSEWMLESEHDEVCVESLTETMKSIRLAGKQSTKRWNLFIKRFMFASCASDWWVEEDECWRRSELWDFEDSGFMLQEGVDPLHDLYEAVDFCSEGLCSQCADSLDSYAKRHMERFLEEIESIDK